ncbi:hypothetical protein NIES4074_42920 [Cylindrospermum sp. NIES-4074]|nr:hypothetical protein NIES4074_42920 [Cylindrospermum sp. NIES-4074]
MVLLHATPKYQVFYFQSIIEVVRGLDLGTKPNIQLKILTSSLLHLKL